MHVSQIIQRTIIRGQHGMDILDHSSKPCGLLEKVFACAPDISILHCLEICKKLTFGKKLINGLKFPVNRTVIDDIVCIIRLGIKLFHLHIHGGKSIVIYSRILRNIISSCERDHF